MPYNVEAAEEIHDADLHIHCNSWSINNGDLVIFGCWGISLCTRSSTCTCGLPRLQADRVQKVPVCQHGSNYLELLWEIECNSVILVSRLEVFTWLDESDDRGSHADLGIVYIVSRDISEQSLQDRHQILGGRPKQLY